MKILNSNLDKVEFLSQSIKKGDYIEASELEKEFGYDRYSREFSVIMSRLRGKCNRKWFVVKQSDYGFKVLTDKEATAFNHRGFVKKIQGAALKNELQKRIDTSTFTQDEKDEHAKRLAVQERLMQPVYDVIAEHTSSLNKKKYWPKLQSI